MAARFETKGGEEKTENEIIKLLQSIAYYDNLIKAKYKHCNAIINKSDCEKESDCYYGVNPEFPDLPEKCNMLNAYSYARNEDLNSYWSKSLPLRRRCNDHTLWDECNSDPFCQVESYTKPQLLEGKWTTNPRQIIMTTSSKNPWEARIGETPWRCNLKTKYFLLPNGVPVSPLPSLTR